MGSRPSQQSMVLIGSFASNLPTNVMSFNMVVLPDALMPMKDSTLTNSSVLSNKFLTFVQRLCKQDNHVCD